MTVQSIHSKHPILTKELEQGYALQVTLKSTSDGLKLVSCLINQTTHQVKKTQLVGCPQTARHDEVSAVYMFLCNAFFQMKEGVVQCTPPLKGGMPSTPLEELIQSCKEVSSDS